MFMIHTLSDVFDVIAFTLLIVATVFSYKTSRILKTRLVSYLTLGFFTSALVQIGLIIMNYVPLEIVIENDRMYGGILVALRVIPIFFLMLGIIGIYVTSVKYVQEKQDYDGKNDRRKK